MHFIEENHVMNTSRKGILDEEIRIINAWGR